MRAGKEMNASPGEFFDQLRKCVRASHKGFDATTVGDQLNLDILFAQVSQQVFDISKHLFSAAFAGFVEVEEHAVCCHRNFLMGHSGWTSNVCY